MKSVLKRLLVASRPVSWVNTAYPFAAAYLVVTRQADALLIIGTLYFLIPYNLLMYGINDIFDYESDLRNPRKGGIEGAVLERSFLKVMGWAVAITNIPFLIAMVVLGSAGATAVLAVVLFMQFAYTIPGLRFKERPVLDSVTSSTHFVGPMVYGLVAAGFMAGWWPLVAAFFLWGMASHAFGAVQDINADKAGGIGSIATVIGARRTVWLSAGLYALSSLLLMTYSRPTIFIGLSVLLYIANIWPFMNVKDADAESANAGWRRFIWLNYFTGFVVTMVLIIVLT